MTRTEQIDFEIYVMNLCEKCKIAEDFEDMAEDLHICIENAISDMCMDLGIEDYESSY